MQAGRLGWRWGGSWVLGRGALLRDASCAAAQSWDAAVASAVAVLCWERHQRAGVCAG